MKCKRIIGVVMSLVMIAGIVGPVTDVAAQDPETQTAASVNLGDVLQISVNGGSKNLMSLYSNGLYEGKVTLSSGENTYQMFLNNQLIKEGTINAESEEDIYIRYQAFQDKVTTQKDGADQFKYPATWTGNFSNVTKQDGTKYLWLNDWATDDTNANLDYIGGGCFRKTFTYDEMESEQSMEYKVAFGGDWNHGAVPGSNKQLTFPQGSTEITIWVNSITEETFDSITDGNITAKLAGDTDYEKAVGTMDMKLKVDEQEISMVQTGKDSYMATVIAEAGTHSYQNLIDNQEGALNGSFNLTEEKAVTFLYDAGDNTMINSVTDTEALASAIDWSLPVDLDEYKYDGNDLGAVYSPESTTFKVWAPTASQVMLKRYTKGSSSEAGDQVIEEVEMEKDLGADGTWSNGVWKVTVNGDLVNTYYTYLVTVDNNTKETNDVYAKAVGLNGERAMVVDLASTNPEGWETDTHVMVDKPTDAVVWEVHVRDFSSDASSGMQNKGKFLAFTEKGTTVNGEGKLATGVDYLKELGVNYVQLLPAFDYVNDETDESNESYDWGYSPLNYNVPEGLYSTDPTDGNVRITEFKQMVQSLHDENIGVVMDVVFNHVGGDAKESWFNRTVPGYYFRQDDWGNLVDSGTACGNETASEAEMYRKYMVDSVVYWATEYHIDGFRFDLMGCHDIETMRQIREALDQLPGGENILVYGEPWSAGTTNEAEGVTMVSQDNMKLLDERIGAFNDFIRDSLKGRVFDDTSTGFVQAGNNTPQPASCPVYTDTDTMAGLSGNSNPALPDNWATLPSQVVSYVSVHDNLGLYDKLQYSVNGVTQEGDERYYQRDDNLVNMNKMAAAAIITSPGTTFFQAGEEMARSKGGVENSYNSPLYYENGNVLNQIDWTRRETFSDLWDYYKGLLALRKEYAPFRAADMSTVNNMTFSEDNVDNLIAYTISSPGEKWDMVAVIMNSNTTAQEVTLKAKEGVELPTAWNCVVNQKSAGVDTLETYEGTTITVPAQTVLVLTAQNQADQPDDTENPDDTEKPDDQKPQDNNNSGDKTNVTDNNNSNNNNNSNINSNNNNTASASQNQQNSNAGATEQNVKAAKTGDTTSLFLPVALGAVALITICAAVCRRKKYIKNI